MSIEAFFVKNIFFCLPTWDCENCFCRDLNLARAIKWHYSAYLYSASIYPILELFEIEYDIQDGRPTDFSKESSSVWDQWTLGQFWWPSHNDGWKRSKWLHWLHAARTCLKPFARRCVYTWHSFGAFRPLPRGWSTHSKLPSSIRLKQAACRSCGCIVHVPLYHVRRTKSSLEKNSCTAPGENALKLDWGFETLIHCEKM